MLKQCVLSQELESWLFKYEDLMPSTCWNQCTCRFPSYMRCLRDYEMAVIVLLLFNRGRCNASTQRENWWVKCYCWWQKHKKSEKMFLHCVVCYSVTTTTPVFSHLIGGEIPPSAASFTKLAEHVLRFRLFGLLLCLFFFQSEETSEVHETHTVGQTSDVSKEIGGWPGESKLWHRIDRQRMTLKISTWGFHAENISWYFAGKNKNLPLIIHKLIIDSGFFLFLSIHLIENHCYGAQK